jgi:hypothetical protein
MKRDSVLPTLAPPTTMVPKPLFTVKSDNLWACQGKLLGIRSFHRSATSPPPLVTRPDRSTALRAPGLRREWHSMARILAMSTTVQVVTAAVTLNHLTARTHRCISKVIRPPLTFPVTHGLTFQQRMQAQRLSSNERIKSIGRLFHSHT